MYRISPFTPIFFTPSKDRNGVKSYCGQVFSQSDRILIEVIAVGEGDAPPSANLAIQNICTGYESVYLWRSWRMNDDTTLYFVELQWMSNGVYTAKIGSMESEPFSVTDDACVLDDTVLLQYSNRDNRQRNDAVFWIDGMHRFFDFRVPGGFKDDNWTFSVTGEQFVTSDNDSIDLFGQERTIKALTLGNSEGCPVWFADMLNRLLCCNYVYVDGERYSRNEGEVPEMTAVVEGLKSYIFTQGLQRVMNLDPLLEERNLLIMRRTEEDYRVTTIDNETFNLII